MTTINWDLAWRRVSQLPDFKGRKQWQYRFMAIGKQFSLASGVVGASTSVDFPSGAIILGMGAGLSVSAAATAEIRSLNAARLQIDLPGSDGSLTGGLRLNLASLVGPWSNRQFPAKELILPLQGALTLTPENLSTSTIALDITFHTMIYRASAA
jgi:hypothetical protein